MRCIPTLLLWPTLLWAKAPTLSHLFPAGGQLGSTVELKLSGMVEGDQVWTDDPAVQIQPMGKDSAKATIGSAAAPGLHWLRLFNAEGASEPRWFSVGSAVEIKEVEPNDELGSPMAVDHLPVCINGVLEKRASVDLFAVELAAGDVLTAAVECYSLGSPLDTFLELRSAAGDLLQTTHDGHSLDPVLSYTVTQPGRHMLQLAGFVHPPSADNRFSGEASAVYRLHVAKTAVPVAVHPPVVSRTAANTLTVLGSKELPEKQQRMEVDSKSWRSQPETQHVFPTQALWPIPVLVTDSAVRQETEPNDSADKAMPLKLHDVVAGKIDKPGDKDRYQFAAEKGSYYTVKFHSRSLGLPTEGKLSMRSLHGDELLKEHTDSDLGDPLFSWKSTVSGPVRLVVEDLFGKGSSRHSYAFSLLPGFEPVAAEVTGSQFVLESGKTQELKAKLKLRFGYSGSITARMTGLPEGVAADPVTLPNKDGSEITLTLRASVEAPAFSGPVQLSLWHGYKEGPIHSTPAAAVNRGESERGITQRDRIQQLWLTVKPQAPVAPGK
jgi:hypothetical protein